ncbi:hypothetical protein JRO89_XS08G0247400 [Xanthoceras sorbifolium]|uniref:Uncharacterized protein n=1 Tax=Xanthoceras sorbifolium TaxID=99658 RepID=A0ABQ8HRD9_9ROSI|nr:hypothetical protein JRO89_XS08G0247400 [Xanthoceras sorbifolium]
MRVSEMQQQKRMLEEPLKQSDTIELESGRALDDLRETKKLAHEANMRRNEAMSTGKVSDIYTEVNMLNETFSQELKMKDKNMESLKVELEKAKQDLSDKDASMEKLKEELDNMKSFESKALSLLDETEIQFQELENEIEKRKESEQKMFDSFNVQTRELEQTKMSLVESKLEIDSLRIKLKKLEGLSNGLGAPESSSSLDDKEEAFQSLKSELQLAKNELKSATEAEENSKKALDDLALALKEVATEANQMKEKLMTTQEELEQTKDEAEQYLSKLKSAEEKLDEVKKEADVYKNTSERLRLEAEDSLIAWIGKETGFVECIKRAEEERDAAQQEKTSLLESLKAAEDAIKTGKQENHKLRDILKQALNEANVAKEAASIATAENSQLKDALHDKEQALEFIIQENQNLKMNEAAALESIKELKRLLGKGTNKEIKSEDIEPTPQELQPQNSVDKEHSEGKKLLSEFGFNIKELKIPHKSINADKDGDEDPNKHSDEDCDSARADPLKGSIFDTDSPVSQPGTQTHHQTHHRRRSSTLTDGGDAASSDDFESLDGAQFEDAEGDKSSRKKKALLRRFGDLLMRRNYHRKEPSLESSV